jgi:FMN phosphatase YigB (HAD superfamily)
MSHQYEAILFDAGGVLVYPDPEVLAPTLHYYGASAEHVLYFRAHYAGMAAKSRAGRGEADWDEYNFEYVRTVGVPAHNHDEAAFVLSRTRNAHIWRAPINDSVRALRELNAAGMPIGVVSNASGQIQEILHRSGVCQVGSGDLAQVRCVVDSHIVGVAKPDPKIFDYAFPHFEGIERSRIAYVGDSVTMDVGGATAAGLIPVLIDPFNDAADLFGGRRIASLLELL